MTLQHCIDLVRDADPDRFSVTRAASDADQARLFPLYALNIEIGRAAWASNSPLVSEMRLQWWRDALSALTDGGSAPPHPVLEACDFLRGDGLAGMALDQILEARRWDIWSEPFADDQALWTHLEDLSGNLFWLTAHSLGADAELAPILRQYGSVVGLAHWLQAVPELIKRERAPLPEASPAGIRALAQQGLARLAEVKAQRAAIPRQVLPVMLSGWQVEALLSAAANSPEIVLAGDLKLSEFKRRGGLAWRAILQRW